MLMADSKQTDSSFVGNVQEFISSNMAKYLKNFETQNEIRTENIPDLIENRPAPLENPTLAEAANNAYRTVPYIAGQVATSTAELAETVSDDPGVIVDAAKAVGNAIWNPQSVPMIEALASKFNITYFDGSNANDFRSQEEIREIQRPLDNWVESRKKIYGSWDEFKRTLANAPEKIGSDVGLALGLKGAAAITINNTIPNTSINEIVNKITPESDLIPAMATAGNNLTPNIATTLPDPAAPTIRSMLGGVGMVGTGTSKNYRKANKLLKKYYKNQEFPDENPDQGSIDFKTNKEIWEQTNWYIDPNDGQWRFYIDDSKSKLNNIEDVFKDNEITQGEIQGSQFLKGEGLTTRLGDIFDHPELYKKYPTFKNLPVEFYDNPLSKSLGIASGFGKMELGRQSAVGINLANHKNADSIHSTILHEIQHVIQRREGFVPGANRQGIEDDLLDKRQVVLDERIKPIETEKDRLVNELNATNNSFERILLQNKEPIKGLTADQEFEIYKLKPIDPETKKTGGPTWTSIGKDYGVSSAQIQKAWARQNVVENLTKEKIKLNKNIYKLQIKIEDLNWEIQNADFEFYRGAGGEIESRLVQKMAKNTSKTTEFPLETRTKMLMEEGNKFEYQGEFGVDPLRYKTDTRDQPRKETFLEKLRRKSITRKRQKDRGYKYAEGGSVNNMTRQMKMFEEGGIADDGMSRDPVSGNEIPSGSLAEEVRDDIPAQLSEGEYVVPADVVRYFGVRVFEDMRMEAKMGLQKMEQDGRIGGEPIDAPAVRSNTDDLSPEEQEILREIMAMEQPQEQPAGFAPGGLASGYSVPSGFDSLTDFVTSPTRVQDQFKTLGGSYIADGTTDTAVEPVGPVVNKVCPPGQIFSEKSQMCIIDPNTYKNNDDDGGKTVIPEPEDWGDDIDWTYSEGMTGYVDSVLTPMDKGLQKGLQIGGAMAGGFLGLGVGLLPVADAMNDLSNARATSLIARAMGDTATADAIDAKISVYVEKAPAIATSWLGNWLSSGTSRANRLAREMGFDNLADAETNSQAFADKLGRLSEEEVKIRAKRQAGQITAAGVAPKTSGKNKNIVSAGVDKADATTAAIKAQYGGKMPTKVEEKAARAAGVDLLGNKLSKTEDQLTRADKVNRKVQIDKVIEEKKKSGQLDKDGRARGGRNKGGLIKKRKKK